MSSTLYRKYRPESFAEIIGQKYIVQALSNAVKYDKVGQAYLFTGPRGTGKTSMARILAKAVNCEKNIKGNPCKKCENCKAIIDGRSLDIFEIDAASNTGVENIRELRETVKLPPAKLKYKIYIIDEVHMLSTGAFNALLKTLEEPPSHVIFILATTEIHKVPETIISRCQRFDFARISIESIIKKLSKIAGSEKIKIDKEALENIAISSEGGMRDAESLLAQIISLEDKHITAKEVQEILGTTRHEALEKMTELIVDKKTSLAISFLNEIVQNGYDIEVFYKSLLNYIRQLMLVCVDEKLSESFSFELTSEQIDKLKKISKKTTARDILLMADIISQIQPALKSSFIPQLPLEIAIVKITKNFSAAPNVEAKQTKKEYDKTASKKKEVREIIETEKKEVTSERKDARKIFTHDVKKIWKNACENIQKENSSLASILPNCIVSKVEENMITIVAKYSFYKDKLNEANNRLTIESALDKLLESDVQIKVLTEEEAGVKIPQKNIPNSTSNGDIQSENKTSSLLSEAMNIIGGKLEE